MNSISGAVPQPQTPSPASAARQTAPLDAEEELRQARDSYDAVDKQYTSLNDDYSSSMTAMQRNRKAHRILSGVALGGLGIFLTGTVMATMLPFAGGAALGAVTYIASGYFKGRTRFFRTQGDQAASQLITARDSLNKAGDRLKRAQSVVERSKQDMADYQKSLGRSQSESAIIEDENVVAVEGVRLRKRHAELRSVISDLFGELNRK